MTRPKPSIAEAYAKHRAAFILRTPFGHLMPDDIRDMIKATARDAGVSIEAVNAEVSVKNIPLADEANHSDGGSALSELTTSQGTDHD